MNRLELQEKFVETKDNVINYKEKFVDLISCGKK